MTAPDMTAARLLRTITLLIALMPAGDIRRISSAVCFMNVSRPLTTDLLHRGALSADPDSLRPDPSLFERISGRPVIERFTDDFYRRIGADPQLAPLFTHFQHARQTQKLFFEEWMGGIPSLARRAGVFITPTPP